MSLICQEENNVRAGYLDKPLTARLGSGAKNSDMAIVVAGAATVNGVAVPVAVTPGISDGRMTEITGGDLQAGMQVITDQKASAAK
jgi:multidrug efflux pump subunit AcrA (membrane-fusion protein)